ncbi:cysteine--tRNA ligase [Gammaproteobacteria bacterium]
MLQIHNSLTNHKESFTSITPGEVRLYVCGMTVYDYCHIGHARVMVVFDVVVRYLRNRGFAVTYVRNITDIDDKIIHRAAENSEDISTLTARFITAMRQDAQSLGVLPPDQEPRATDSIPLMLAMIGRLLASRHAYQASNGDIYYDVSCFPNYGQLSGKHPEELRAGARVEVTEAKDDPLDFVLWKAAKPSEPAWDAPWGAGRPGWHIECSAMSTAALGNHFDIHGGGADLQFPHHENEIAQSESATGEPFVNYWMHNGFVRVDNEKMSKSLGNFFTVREVLIHYSPEVLRFFIIFSHYRSPLNYSDQNLDLARTALTRLYTALRGLNRMDNFVESNFTARFHASMEDDFNTPQALAVCFDLAREINRIRNEDKSQASCLATELRYLGGILGLLQDDPDVFLHGGMISGVNDEFKLNLNTDKDQFTSGSLDSTAIDAAILARQTARKAKNFAISDRIRDELKQQGILLEDRHDGVTTWSRR